MKKQILLAALLAGATLGVNAQTTTPTTTNSQGTTNNQSTNNGTTTIQQGTNTANRPYQSQTNYNMMTESGIPQNIRDTYGSSYNGATGTKWEGDGTNYRSTFQQNGKNMSVIYDKNGKMTESRTSMEMTDFPQSVQTAMKGRNANMPYEVKMGNNTYYSATVGDQEMYYDKTGKSVDMNSMRNPKMK